MYNICLSAHSIDSYIYCLCIINMNMYINILSIEGYTLHFGSKSNIVYRICTLWCIRKVHCPALPPPPNMSQLGPPRPKGTHRCSWKSDASVGKFDESQKWRKPLRRVWLHSFDKSWRCSMMYHVLYKLCKCMQMWRSLLMYAQLVSVVRAKTNRSVGEFPTFHNGSVVQLVAEHQDSAASGLGWPSWIAASHGWLWLADAHLRLKESWQNGGVGGKASGERLRGEQLPTK